jgi:hypothetical protein
MATAAPPETGSPITFTSTPSTIMEAGTCSNAARAGRTHPTADTATTANVAKQRIRAMGDLLARLTT